MGFVLAYGQFPVDSGLEAYYADTSFEVLPEGAAIDLGPPLGMPMLVSPDPGERLFARWAIPGFRAIRHTKRWHR
ncbi:hypothetical protein [Glycomyces buryatensis]|uniref:Uncharacterized protein n=1 Tax=Glycomyces buryatensis TaxID=2570927 RepID=A0A4V4HSV1_9ACTN|nr:hypothetical protein [Glycomyces buryatensis]THV43096.1 hypothetical protein FAB82_02360 [Glycomyces buryatensis]